MAGKSDNYSIFKRIDTAKPFCRAQSILSCLEKTQSQSFELKDPALHSFPEFSLHKVSFPCRARNLSVLSGFSLWNLCSTCEILDRPVCIVSASSSKCRLYRLITPVPVILCLHCTWGSFGQVHQSSSGTCSGRKQMRQVICCLRSGTSPMNNFKIALEDVAAVAVACCVIGHVQDPSQSVVTRLYT